MLRIDAKALVTLLLLLAYPATASATRGSGDYGLIFFFVFVFCTLPIGAALLGMIIYSVVALTSAKRPTLGAVNAIFGFAVVLLVPSLVVPTLVVAGADEPERMVGLMLGAFLPLVVMAVAALVMSVLLKKRLRQPDANDEGVEETPCR